MARSKVFRDSILGDVEVREFELAVIHTRIFQRLHFVRQLGLAPMVFHDAVHTRFQHSIGTLAHAQRFADALRRNGHPISDQELAVLRLSALLHDVTHIPFGHTLEDEMGVFHTRHEERVRPLLQKLAAELEGTPYSRQAEELLPQVQTVIQAYAPHRGTAEDQGVERKDDAKVADGEDQDVKPIEPERYYLADIVGNTISADLFDYTKRDVRFTGLDMSYADRLLSYLVLDTDAKGRKRLVIRLYKDKLRSDIISDIIQILRVRYCLAERVYYHHAKCAASAMLGKVVVLSGLKPEEAYEVGDEGILRILHDRLKPQKEGDAEGGDDRSVAWRLLDRLLSRRLHKAIFRVTYDERVDYKRKTGRDLPREYCSHGDGKARAQLERGLEAYLELGPGAAGAVLVYCPTERMQLKETQVMVDFGHEPVSLNSDDVQKLYPKVYDEVKALESKYEALWNMTILLDERYMPLAPLAVDWIAHQHFRGEVANDPLLQAALSGRPEVKTGMQTLAKVHEVLVDAAPGAVRSALAQAARDKSGAASAPDIAESVYRALDDALHTLRKQPREPRRAAGSETARKAPKEGPPRGTAKLGIEGEAPPGDGE